MGGRHLGPPVERGCPLYKGLFDVFDEGLGMGLRKLSVDEVPGVNVEISQE